MENVFLLDVIIGFEHGKSGCLSYINSNCGGGLWLCCREGWSSGFRSGPRGERSWKWTATPGTADDVLLCVCHQQHSFVLQYHLHCSPHRAT